jgi:hypothetical protein
MKREDTAMGWRRILAATLLGGLAALALTGCYIVSPDAYPSYAPAYPPPYGPPPFPPPPVGPPVPAPSGAPPVPTPGAAGAPQGSAQRCETVTIEGHYETLIRPGGQQETVWVPTRSEQVCR